MLHIFVVLPTKCLWNKADCIPAQTNYIPEVCPFIPHTHTLLSLSLSLSQVSHELSHTLSSTHIPLPSHCTSLSFAHSLSTTNMAAKSDGAAVCESASRCLLGPEQSAAPLHPHAEKRFSLLDCCWVLCALLVFFSDGATDLWLAADYYLRRDYWWFGLTLVFVVVPSAVVQVLSFRWFVYDYSEMSASPTGDGCDFSTKDSDRRSGSGRTLPANGTRKCCRVCMWLFQSIIHILQLGQVWR